MRHYVVGFLFGDNRKCVALIKKQRPAWQKGLYNGIGGHVEQRDSRPVNSIVTTYYTAMVREFEEETTVKVTEWKYFCSIIHSESKSNSGPWTVHFFKSFQEVATLQSPTDEQVSWWHVNAVCCDLNDYFVPNLRWLIPMALEDLTAEVQQLNWTHDN